MGCSASRPGPCGEGAKGFGSGIAPFRRRNDEIKRQKRTKCSGTLSSKELLTKEYGMSPSGSKRFPGSYDFDKEESQIKDPEMYERKQDEKTVSGVSDERKISGSLDEKKVTGAPEDDQKRDPEIEDGKGGEEEEEEVTVGELGFGDVPSSPSFREYFKSANNLENGDSGKVEGGKEGRELLSSSSLLSKTFKKAKPTMDGLWS